MRQNFKTLISVAFDNRQATDEMQRQIKSLQKTAKLTFDIELSDKEAEKAIEDITKKWTNLRKEAAGSITAPNKVLKDMSKFYKEQERTIQANKRMESSLHNVQTRAEGAGKGFQSYLNKLNPKALRDYASEINKVSDMFTKAQKTGDRLDYRKANAELYKFKNTMKEAGLETGSLTQKLKENISAFTNWYLIGNMIGRLARTLRQVVTEVINIDEAMINLKKVTDETADTYDKFLTTAATSAKELGSSIADLVNLTADFARLGYSLPDATELANVATLYKNVGDGISTTDASSSIISTMKAFNIEAEDSITIVDKFNEVGNRFAISSAGIGDALQRSASSLVTANNTLDEAIALIVAANNVIQNPEKVGTMWNTVALRIRGATTELEEAGLATDAMATSTSTLRKELKAITGFDIMIDDDTFKSTYDIIIGIAEVFDDLSDIDQANVLEKLAGKRQANALAAALNNTEDLIKTLETSQNSAGSALEEQEKYMEGIEYSIERLKGSFGELAMTTLDSSTVKFFVDSSDAVVNLITDMGGLIPVLGLVAITMGTTRFAMKTLMLDTDKYTLTNLAATVSTYGLADSVRTLTTAMITSPIGWGLLAITAVVGLYKAYDHFNVTLEDNQEILAQQTQEYNAITSEVEKLEEQLQNTKDKLEELNNIDGASLTKDGEQERLEKQTEELQRQLDIAKEQQRIAALETEEMAVETLTTTIDSRYDSRIVRSEFTGGSIKYQQRTRDEELQRAIDEYNQLSETYSKLEKEQQKLANANKGTTKEFENNKDVLKDLKNQQEDAREYASSLATELQKEAESIVGVTDAGKEQQVVVDSILATYTNWLNEIDGVSDSQEDLEEQINENNLSLEEQNKILEAQNKIIDDYQKSLSSIEKALKDTDNLSSSETFDLMQEFHDFDWDAFGVTGVKGVGNLKGALSELALQLKDNIDVSSEQRAAMQAMYEETVTATVGVEDLALVTDAVNKKTELTREQVEYLTEKYSDLTNQLVKTENGWHLEKTAISSVEKAIESLKNTYVKAQREMSNILETEGYKRLKALGIEVASMKSMEDVYRAMSMTPGGSEITYADLNPIREWFNLQEKAFQDVFTTPPPSPSSGSSSKKADDPAWLKEYNKLKDNLDHRLAMDEISEANYYNELEKINDKYMKKHKDTHLSQYRKNVEEIYKGRKKLNTDAIKSIFDDLKFEFDMDMISEEKYYSKLRKLNDKYYKGVAQYQSEYRSNLLALHNWETSQTEKKLQEQILAYEKYIKEIDAILNEINHISNFVDKDSIEQLTLYQTGYAQASQKVASLNKEIEKLNKQYTKGKISEEQYTDTLDKLTSQLYSATSAMKSYSDSIISTMRARYDEQRQSIEEMQENELQELEKANDRIIDSLNEQLKRHKEIVDEKKKSLRATKEEHDYQKKINEHAKSISSLESRIAELNKAASTGDREALAEKRKLEEELAKEKESLQDTQYDREVKLAEDALDESFSAYEKMIKNQIDAQEKLYNTERSSIESSYQLKLDKINNLYENERRLIIEAAELTSVEFSKAFTSINATLSQYGMNISSTFQDVYHNTGKTMGGVSTVSDILGDGTNYGQDTTGLSRLNQWLGSSGYNTITKKQMVEIAKALGISGINSVDDVQDTKEGRVNKNRILEVLKKATFHDGGYVNALGHKEGLALVEHGEPVLTVEQGRLFKELVNNIKPLNSLVKLNTPHLSNAIDRSNFSPIFNMDGMITINGNADNSTVAELRKYETELVNKIAKEILGVKRKS